jgi:hypothetical protein
MPEVLSQSVWVRTRREWAHNAIPGRFGPRYGPNKYHRDRNCRCILKAEAATTLHDIITLELTEAECRRRKWTPCKVCCPELQV